MVKKLIKNINYSNIKTILPYIVIVAQLWSFDLFLRSLNYFPALSLLNPLPNIVTLLYILLFISIISAFKNKAKKIVYLILIWIYFILLFSIFVYITVETHIASFSLFNFVGEGTEYVIPVIYDALVSCPYSVIFFVTQIVVSFVIAHVLSTRPRHNISFFIISLIIFVFSITSLEALSFVDYNSTRSDDTNENYQKSPLSLNYEFSDKDRCFSIVGIFHHVSKDLICSLLESNSIGSKTIIPEDDKNFLISQYSNQSMHPANSHTGLLSGKNVILLQLEGLDYSVMSSDTTPNLINLGDSGINFIQHYSNSVLAASTIGSELSVNNGLFPPVSYLYNSRSLKSIEYPFSLSKQCKKYGYSSHVFHFNRGNFYDREHLYNNWGYSEYNGLKQQYNYDNNPYLSELDTELINNEDFLDSIFADNDKFIDSIITYTPHQSFNQGNPRLYTLYNNNNLDTSDIPKLNNVEVSKIYAKETDDFVGKLIQRLKDNNKLENTVIVAYADHYLYGLSRYKQTYYQKNLSSIKLESNTPFFIWGQDIPAESIMTFNSQQDILPTLLNLLGINYQENVYCGQDVLDKTDNYVYFDDCSFYDGHFYVNNEQVMYIDREYSTDNYQTHKASYNPVSQCYEYYDNQISLATIKERQKKIRDIIKKNDYTFKYNYLSKI